jgi:hypothetical protein
MSLMLRPTVSRPVCLGIKHPSGVYDQIYYCQTVAVLLMWGAFFDERTSLSFKIAAGPRQRSHCRVRVPWDLWPYFSVSDSRLPLSKNQSLRKRVCQLVSKQWAYVSRYSILKAARPEWPTGVPPFILFRGLRLVYMPTLSNNVANLLFGTEVTC